MGLVVRPRVPFRDDYIRSSGAKALPFWMPIELQKPSVVGASGSCCTTLPDISTMLRFGGLAERFGPWNGVWKRFDRLSKAGVFEASFDTLASMSSSARLIQMFDSTSRVSANHKPDVQRHIVRTVIWRETVNIANFGAAFM